MCVQAKYLNVTILNTGEIERGFVVEYQYVKDTNAGINVLMKKLEETQAIIEEITYLLPADNH